MATEIAPTSPYVGPRPFQRGEGKLFFGREWEVDQLMALIAANPAVLLYAQSGAGKTSLINAKLVPSLEREHFDVLPPARVGGLPFDDGDTRNDRNAYMSNVLGDWITLDQEPQRAASLTLVEFLRERPRVTDGISECPRLIILDQFEEFFSLSPGTLDEREGFFQQIADALVDDPLLRVMFAVREDYLAEFDPYAPLLLDSLRARFRLERLREDAALEAVRGPALSGGRTFAPGVAEKLVQDLMMSRLLRPNGEVIQVSGEFVEPVQLQVVCESIWTNLNKWVTEITEVHLERFGDIDEALIGFYERALIATSIESGAPEDTLRQWCEDSLITPLGTRSTVLRERKMTGGLPNAAVDDLEHHHLIRGEQRAGARWYELSHDRFVEPIQASNARWRDRVEGEVAQTTRRRTGLAQVAAGAGQVAVVAYLVSSLLALQSFAPDLPVSPIVILFISVAIALIVPIVQVVLNIQGRLSPPLEPKPANRPFFRRRV